MTPRPLVARGIDNLRRVILTGVSALATAGMIVIGLAGCGSGDALPATPDTFATTETVRPAWPQTFTDLTALKASSDLGVEGTVTTVGQASRGNDHDTSVTTPVEIHIDKVVWNPRRQQVGPSVTIHQIGGYIGNTFFSVEDDPLLKQGEHTLVFLKASGPHGYEVSGGPTGRFVIDGFAVLPASRAGLQLPGGTTLSDFEAQLSR
jgi:hypothetical protein